MKPSRIILPFAASILLLSCQVPTSSDPGIEAQSKGEIAMTVPEHGIHYLEIVTPEAEALKDFYSEAYGWKFSEATPELGNAFFTKQPDESLWGIRSPLRETEEPIVRIYLRVADIEKAVHKAEELGATIALGPTEIPGRGKISIYLLGGIEHGLWQVP